MPSKSKSSEPKPVGDEAIRQRAYLMWEAEGRKDGMSEHYWHRAAAEVGSNSAVTKAKPPAKAAAAKPAAAKAGKKTETAAPAANGAKKAATAAAAKKLEPKPRAAVGTRKAKAPAN